MLHPSFTLPSFPHTHFPFQKTFIFESALKNPLIYINVKKAQNVTQKTDFFEI